MAGTTVGDFLYITYFNPEINPCQEGVLFICLMALYLRKFFFFFERKKKKKKKEKKTRLPTEKIREDTVQFLLM